MAEETTMSAEEKGKHADCKDCCHRHHHGRGHGVASGAYGLGFIGALVYFLQHSTTFWMGVLGVLKAIVWPALLVHKLLDFLKL